MSRSFSLPAGLLAFALSCVPATDDLTPHGAGGYTLEPSAATRGEPFVTDDGFTVTITHTVLLGSISAFSNDENADMGSELVLFSANGREAVWAGGVSTGQATLSFTNGALELGVRYDDLIVHDEAQGARERFERAPDLRQTYAASTPSEDGIDEGDDPSSPVDEEPGIGPSLWIALSAERDGQRYTLDLTLDASFYASGADFAPPPPVTIEANALRTLPLSIRAECILQEFLPDGFFEGEGEGEGEGEAEPAPRPFEFGVYAAADADGDGVITANELRAASIDKAEGWSSTLADELLLRTRAMLLVP